jgi:hypothetical protein
MTQSYRPLAGMLPLLLLVGCVSMPSQTQAPEHATQPSAALTESNDATPKPDETAPATPPSSEAGTTSEQPTRTAFAPPPGIQAEPVKSAAPTSPVEEPLAILRVEAGALVTQVNGDPKVRCTRPDCSIPLTPGTHRLTVLYRDTTVRAGSRVTYASMYPRVVEVTLKPGHHYSVTASGRYSQKWWIAIEDQTTNTVVYDDRKKAE